MKSDMEGPNDRMHLQGYTNSLDDPYLPQAPSQPDTTRFTRTQYFYPRFRFSVLYRAFVMVDALVAIILWLSGGNSKYFINNIVEFSFLESTFDLAVISLIKFPFYMTLIHFLEQTVILSFDTEYYHLRKSRERWLFWLLCLSNIGIAIYGIVKGCLILWVLITDDSYAGMHRTYYACVIWFFLTGVIGTILSSLSSWALRRLVQHRVLRYFNQAGEQVDKEGTVIPKGASLMRVVSLAKPESGLLAAGGVMLLMSTSVQSVAPLFFGKVVDAALHNLDQMNKTVLILVGIYAAGAITSLVRSWVFTLAGQRLVARLRVQLFQAVVLQDISFFDTNRTGELCNRLSSDTQVLQNAVTVNMSMLGQYLLQIVGSLCLMFYLNASLTGVLLAVVPVVSLSAVRYGQFVKKMRQRFQDRLADAGTHAEESLSSVRTVRSFAGESKVVAAYSDAIEGSYRIGKKLAMAVGAMTGLFSFLAYGAVAAVLWYGGKLVNENTEDPSQGITAGLLTSFLLYTLQVAMGFALLSSLYGDFMQAVGSSVRIFTLLDHKSSMSSPRHPLVLPNLSGEIVFQNVKFTYPSRQDVQVLKGISFKVEPGQMVALVGPSGGGKSTIVSLIERFYDPEEGTILLGGCDLKLLDKNWFRQKISMVGQEPTLFACSIRDNIAYGRGALEAEVVEAAKQANAHEFISSFEDDYKTLVGERGVRLSGGQKQRIAIARALIMDPVLLLLDEATSALDAESEHLVQGAIDRAMKGRTVIVIAHRLSTVRNADMVIVIDNGEIAEMGTHDQLLAQDGVYKRLVLRQLVTGDDGMLSNETDGTLKGAVKRKASQEENGSGKNCYVNGTAHLEREFFDLD